MSTILIVGNKDVGYSIILQKHLIELNHSSLHTVTEMDFSIFLHFQWRKSHNFSNLCFTICNARIWVGYSVLTLLGPTNLYYVILVIGAHYINSTFHCCSFHFSIRVPRQATHFTHFDCIFIMHILHGFYIVDCLSLQSKRGKKCIFNWNICMSALVLILYYVNWAM